MVWIEAYHAEPSHFGRDWLGPRDATAWLGVGDSDVTRMHAMWSGP
jgi:hypothetical protein